MNKRVLILIIFVSVLFTLGLTSSNILYYKTYPIVNITVDGNALPSSDVPAFQIDGRTMVPIRLVSEALDAKVEWNESTRTVSITKPATIKPDPEKDLIEVSTLSIKSFSQDINEVSGKVINNNSDYVDVDLIINFYDYLGLITHAHVKIEGIGPGDAQEFFASFRGTLRGDTRNEVIIDRLIWNP